MMQFKLIEVMISIVIPVLNARSTIKRCLDSILIQRGNYEIIVCDGGSQDGTLEIIENIKDQRLSIVSREDKGQADAIAKGFAASSGKVLAWLCADDSLDHGTLERVEKEFNNPELELLVGACRRVYSDGHINIVCPTAQQFDNITLINCLDQPSVFWSKTLYYRAGELSQDYRLAFDWDLWNRFKKQAPIVKYTKEVLSTYYFTDDNLTSCNPTLSREEASKVICTHAQMGEAVSRLYNYIYEKFDLEGVLDDPRTASHAVIEDYEYFINHAIGVFGRDIVYSYNWNWISQQERGLLWR